MMKIVMPGGSGQVGTLLARALVKEGHEVLVLSRRVLGSDQHPWRTITWDGKTLGPWADEIDGADVVVNLAGRSVNCRYTAANRREIMESRLDSTRVIGQAIAQVQHPPGVWLQASTATIYAHRYDGDNDEFTGIIGGSEKDAPDTWKFSIEVATAWENAVNQAITPRTRKVLMRSAMTMSPDPGGVFDTLLRLARFGLGGSVGDGRQYVSWIHEADFIRAVRFLIEHDALDGPVNLSSPHPLPYTDFMRALREAWGIRIGLPATRWMLEIGTFLMRSESELVLKSRRVVPKRLIDAGFTFTFPHWPPAAKELCERWRSQQANSSPSRRGGRREEVRKVEDRR